MSLILRRRGTAVLGHKVETREGYKYLMSPLAVQIQLHKLSREDLTVYQEPLRGIFITPQATVNIYIRLFTSENIVFPYVATDQVSTARYR